MFFGVRSSRIHFSLWGRNECVTNEPHETSAGRIGKKTKPKKIPTKPKKSLDQKLTPQNSHAEFPSVINWFYETDAIWSKKY